jgi:hypothetical protein
MGLFGFTQLRISSEVAVLDQTKTSRVMRSQNISASDKFSR